MNDVGVIDGFLATFTAYIDSGFGLLGGEVGFLSTTLIAIDVTLAGLFWAWGADEDVLQRLVKKTLYIGFFAFIIGNFSSLSQILFQSFAGLGLKASGASIDLADFMKPGSVAAVGLDAGEPLLTSASEMMGVTSFFANFVQIAVLLLAWMIVILAFFILAVQLFITLIEFKLTTLAGFVLVPFALWNKTAFLAEKVLGNVVSSGIKVLVLAVIVGIGTGLFAQFTTPPGTEPSIDHALVIMLAALSMLGLGIFGPGIATGLVSGAPQLGAGAAAGTALGAAGLAVAGGAAIAGGASAVAAGARMAPGAARAAIGGGAAAARSAGSLVANTQAAYRAGASAAPGGGLRAAGAGVAQVARSSAAALGQRVAAGAQAVKDSVAGFVSEAAAPSASSAGASAASPSPGDGNAPPAPAWAKRLQRHQRISHGATTAVHALRSGDAGGSGAHPCLRDDSNP